MTLDGILTDTFAPRSAYWPYLWYAGLEAGSPLAPVDSLPHGFWRPLLLVAGKNLEKVL